MDTLATLALIAIACSTIYIACNMPENAKKREETSRERVRGERRARCYADQLSAGVGSTFEFGLADLSTALGSSLGGAAAGVTGTVIDCDDEWVLLSIERGKKRCRAMIRYEQIDSLKEVVP